MNIVVICIIVIILLLMLVILAEYKLKGGEYKQLRNDDKEKDAEKQLFKTEITPSASIIVADKVKNIKSADALLEETKKYLDDNERITFNGFNLIVSSENSNRYISDAHMDALLLADTCDDIYATNEFQKYVARPVSEIVDGKVEISKTKIKISLDKYHKNNMVTLIRNSPLPNYEEELTRATTVIKGRKRGEKFIKQSNAAKLQAFGYKYKEKYVYNLYDNHFNYSKENEGYDGTGSSGRKLFDIPIDGTNIFLEFVYDDIKEIPTAYENIHQQTKVILLNIFERCCNENIKAVFVRVKVENDGTVLSSALSPIAYEVKTAAASS